MCKVHKVFAETCIQSVISSLLNLVLQKAIFRTWSPAVLTTFPLLKSHFLQFTIFTLILISQ